MGPWAKAVVDALGVGHQSVSDTVSGLRVEPSLVTARVDGRAVTLSAPPSVFTVVLLPSAVVLMVMLSVPVPALRLTVSARLTASAP